MTDPRTQQLQYEEDSDFTAAAERLLHLRTQAADGDLELPRTQKLIARAYTAVRESIEAVSAVQTRGVGGKFKSWLRKVPSDVASVIALRVCISSLTIRIGNSDDGWVGIQHLAGEIGRAYELEVKIREAEKVNPVYMSRIHEQVKENNTTSPVHLRRLYNVAYERIMKGEIDSELTAAEQLQLGKFGVQAVLDSGIIILHRTRTSVGSVNAFMLAPDVSEFLMNYSDTDVAGILNNATGAMRCEPDQWSNLQDGGYLSARRKFAKPLMSMRNIRKCERKRLRQQVFTQEQMPTVFAAANYLQSRAFTVHRPTYDAMVRLWRSGGGVMGVPTKGQPAKPTFPFPATWTKADAPDAELDVFQRWKAQCVRHYNDLREWRGKAREIGGFVKTIEQAAGDLYFPVFFDTRGRWYYRGTPNPQGSDISKACLHFANKKRLGDSGLYWLKVHIANCHGYDKARFSARAKWVDDNWDMWSRAVERPEDYPNIWGDSPWCTYSAVYELYMAKASGRPADYETGIVVHMDATCSGLQHFSAMLRDPVGGRYVNLMDVPSSDVKQDIYSKVAENAMAAIKLDSLDSDATKARIALWWLGKGISRALAKKPVMTYVYGATLHGTTGDVRMHMEGEFGEDCWPADIRPYEVASYAAKKLFQGIAATVPSAAAAMQWLRNVARSMPNGQRMEWTTPTGFKVQHDYQDYDEVRVKIRSCGIDNAVVREYTDDTKTLPMQNAISPNFVHALDASHLTLTAMRMAERGLDFVGIHDSFGTHPCDVPALHEDIREAFITLYKDRNVLADFLWEVDGVGEVPMRGDLNLDDIRYSEFFFC